MSSSKPIKKRYILREPPEFITGPAGPVGPQGPPGALTLPYSTNDGDYRGQNLTTVIDSLLYVNPIITSFVAPAQPFEKGQVLTSINLTWGYNKAVVSQAIPGTAIVVAPTLLASDRAKTIVLNNANDDFVITLNGNDGTNVVGNNLLVSFKNKIYFGAAIIPGAMNSAFILSLPNNFADNRLKTFTPNLGAATYGWVAYPTAFGLATFKVNGFDGGMDAPATVSFTNASGHTENYYVYKTTNANLGITDIQVL